MRLTGQMADRSVQICLILRLIHMHRSFDFESLTSGFDFPKHLRMRLGIHAVSVPQQLQPHLLGIRRRLFFFAKPLPHLFLLPL